MNTLYSAEFLTRRSVMTLLDQNIQLREFVPVAPAVNITPAAAERLLAMMAERDISDYALRVFVSGGGCSGLQYGMTFDNEARDGDTNWEAHGLKVMLDPISARYLDGAVISFQQDNMLQGAFKIDNPNAVSSCGCGHSFRSKEEGSADADEYSGGGCGSCGNA
jgi:iron-sulfur cluster assembly accessory protein